MSLAEAKTPSKSAAPGQYLGFSLQQVRLCYHLLKVSDDASVSLEFVDDVAVHLADGSQILEQTKSGLSSNPTSNRNVELWKTFANWAERCAEGLNPETTDFNLYITPAKTGSIAARISEAQSREAVAGALTEIKGLFDPKKSEIGCNPHLAKFLSAGDVACSHIIKNFRLTAEHDPIECIRERLRLLCPPETLDDFCATAIGMARDDVEKLLRQNKLGIVRAKNYRARFRAFVRKYDLSGLLISKAPQPANQVIVALIRTDPTFVRQLRAIDASDDMLVTAVGDYLQTEIDKVSWADEGLIVAESFDELDRQLERRHTILRDEFEDTMKSQSEAERGRALYRRCTDTTIPLEGRTLPQHFIPGAYNWLADACRLGWHPNYKSLFSAD